MRILLRCRNCERRYQVGEEKIGRRFRCHCGEVITIEEPRVHDSPVARCSSCGAPRQPDAVACGFCHSEFVLHERDLHTVCAECLTRVSDRAKFCHSCGERLEAQAVAGEESDYVCPACGDDVKLRSRAIGAEPVNVLECQCCAGLWIGHDNFQQLTKRAAAQGEAIRGLESKPERPEGSQFPKSFRYRPCVHCGKLMARRQYSRGSGIIIDICREHGVWFDDAELSQLLAWIASGGHREQLKKESRKPAPSARPLETMSDGDLFSFSGRGTFGDTDDVFTTILRAFFD